MNTLKVSWDPPVKPNGEILGYIVAYETAEQDESKCYCTYLSPKKGIQGKKYPIIKNILK